MDDLNNPNQTGDESGQNKPQTETDIMPQDYNNRQEQNPYNQPAPPYSQPQNPYNQQNNPYNQPPKASYNIPPAGQSTQNPFTQAAANYQGPPPSTGMAVASLVLGIISIVGITLIFIFPILPVIGLILGIVFKVKKLPVGKGISTAGIILNSLSLVLSVVIWAVSVSLLMDGTLMEFLRIYAPEVFEDYFDMYYEQFPEWFSKSIVAIKSFFFAR